MSATAAPITPLPRKPSPFPTPEALRLERATRRDLELTFQRGITPELESLVGWEFRGINRLPVQAVPVAQLAGIKRFVKGFYRTEGDRVEGYNSPVAGGGPLDGRFDIKDKRFGFFTVEHVDPTARDNFYLHALLFDYAKCKNPALDPARFLKDYLVQVDPTNPDLYLGKAYYALGPARIGTLNYFILERHRRGLTNFARR